METSVCFFKITHNSAKAIFMIKPAMCNAGIRCDEVREIEGLTATT